MGFEMSDLCPTKLLKKMGLEFAPCTKKDWSIDFGMLAKSSFWSCFITEAISTTMIIVIARQLGSEHMHQALAWGLSYALVRFFMGNNEKSFNALCKFYGFLNSKNSVGCFLFTLIAQMLGGFMAFHMFLGGGSVTGFQSRDRREAEASPKADDSADANSSIWYYKNFFSQTNELQAVVFYSFLVCKAAAQNMPDAIWQAIKVATAFYVGGNSIALFPGNAYAGGVSTICSGTAVVAMQLFAVFMAHVFMRWFWPVGFGEYEEETVAEQIEEAVEDKEEAKGFFDKVKDAVGVDSD